MPNSTLHDPVLANLSTSSHGMLPRTVFQPYWLLSVTGSSFLPQGLCTSLLFPLCFFTCFRDVICSESLSLATVCRGNFLQLVILYFIDLCFHIFACLPKLLKNKLQGTEKEAKAKKRSKNNNNKILWKMKRGGKARNWKEIGIKLLILLEKKFIKFLIKFKSRIRLKRTFQPLTSESYVMISNFSAFKIYAFPFSLNSGNYNIFYFNVSKWTLKMSWKDLKKSLGATRRV